MLTGKRIMFAYFGGSFPELSDFLGFSSTRFFSALNIKFRVSKYSHWDGSPVVFSKWASRLRKKIM